MVRGNTSSPPGARRRRLLALPLDTAGLPVGRIILGGMGYSRSTGLLRGVATGPVANAAACTLPIECWLATPTPNGPARWVGVAIIAVGARR